MKKKTGLGQAPIGTAREVLKGERGKKKALTPKTEELPRNHQAAQTQRDKKLPSYRPTPIYTSVEEAKMLLRARYVDRGFDVQRVNRFDKGWFTVSFKEHQGPGGVDSVLCNWPYLDGVKTADQAKAILKERNHQALKDLPKPPTKRRRAKCPKPR